MVHISGGFACLYDGLDCRFVLGLITTGSVNGLFNFLLIFANPVRPATKSLLRIAVVPEG
jgi:hypothetical protein